MADANADLIAAADYVLPGSQAEGAFDDFIKELAEAEKPNQLIKLPERLA